MANRPRPIIIPGPSGMGSNMQQQSSQVNLTAFIKLLDATVGQHMRNKKATAAADVLAPLVLGDVKKEDMGIVTKSAAGRKTIFDMIKQQGKAGAEKEFNMPAKMDEFLSYSQGVHGQDFSTRKGRTESLRWFGTEEGQSLWEEYLKKTKTVVKQTPGMSDIIATRKEFEKSQLTKDYITLKGQSKKMQSAYDMIGKNNVAVDQVLITVLNKMLDPTSVVRESEYARTPENLSLLNRIKGKWAKGWRGGAGLTNEDRKAILDMGTEFSRLTELAYKEFEGSYKKIADYMEVPHNMIITTPTFKTKGQPTKAGATTWQELKAQKGY